MPETLLATLDKRREQYLIDLAQLVNLDCGTENKAGVDEVGRRLAAILTRAGFAVDTLPVAHYGDCLVARLAGPGRARILLVGHTDTVYPDGTAAQRPLTITKGRIYGPGANDMKAGLLSGIYAVEALRASGWDDFAELVFFCNSEEEVGSPVSRTLYADVVRAADAALVLEAARANGAIVSARKGGGHFVITVAGRSAHAGVEPEHGANAVHALAHIVLALQALNGLRQGTTVTVGVVRGGTRSNVVPDLAEAEVDVRVVAPEDIPVVEEAIRAAVAEPHVPGTSATVRGSFGAWPMARTPAIALMAQLAHAAASDLGIDLEDVATGGVSDANQVAAYGTPVLDGLGPIGGLDHSPGEYVELDSIVPRTALLAGLIRRIAEQRDDLVALKAGQFAARA